jgi:hypothetical protein
VLRFPYVAISRIRSVNRSPLGAASQSIADSLSFFYECARRKSRRNSRNAKRKSNALQKNIFWVDFTTNEARLMRQKRTLHCGAGVPPAILAGARATEKRPPRRRRHKELARLHETNE